MATIATIPRSICERIQLYINNERMTLSAIRAQTGADYAINGTLYDLSRWLPVMHFRADGVTHSSDPYNYYGYGWDGGSDIRVVQSKDKSSVRNYICGVELVRDGKPCQTLYYDPAVGGVRGRTAIALKGDNLILYCVGDGQSGRCSPEELRGELVALGVDSAVMLDGGLSSQCIFPSASVTSSRIVENVILVYLKQKEVQPMPNYDCTVFLDPGHGGSTGLLRDCSNGSPDGTYKEHVFSLDLAQRIKKILQEQGIRVVMSREADMYVALAKRASLANRAKATLFLSIHTNAAANGGWADPSGLVVYTHDAGGKRDELARDILNRVKEAGVRTFGQELYHNKKFVVLRDTNMPAVLVEYGFHTSRSDVALLKSDSYKDKLALATAKAVVIDYLKKPWIAAAEKKTYVVEFGSFSNAAAAQALVDKLKDVGITATIKEV